MVERAAEGMITEWKTMPQGAAGAAQQLAIYQNLVGPTVAQFTKVMAELARVARMSEQHWRLLGIHMVPWDLADPVEFEFPPRDAYRPAWHALRLEMGR